MKIRALSFLIALGICVCLLPLSVSADVDAPIIVDYKGGSMEDIIGCNYILKGEATVSASTFLYKYSTLQIGKDATLYVKRGVTLEIRGELQIEEGGRLIVQEGAALIFNHEYGHTKIDGTLESKKGSAVWIKQGNIIVGKQGQINYNGALNEAKDAGAYTIAVAGKITKGKDGVTTAKIIKNNSETIVMPSFPSMPVIYADAKALRFGSRSGINPRNIEDLENLKYLTSLEKLEFYDGYVKDLNMLKGLTKLKTLDLKYMQVEDISVLKDLKSLRTLRMSAYPTEKQFGVLKQLKSLKTLDISIVFLEDEPVPAALKNLEKALPDTKIIYGDKIYTAQYNSFYAKITEATGYGYPKKFKLCDKKGVIISDFEFCMSRIDRYLSSDELEVVTVEFNEKGKYDYRLTFKEGDVVKIYYDYRETSTGPGTTALGLKVDEYAAKKPDYDVYVYAYRIDKV